MADNTPIEWTDATWNPITGCSVHSAGCKNCYAMLLAGTRLSSHSSRVGLTVDTKAGPVWTGEVRFNEQWLTEPLRWRRPRRIFVVAHGDLFHEAVPDEWIDRVFAVMALCPHHQFQVLTKRAERMRDYLSSIYDCFHASPEALDDRFGDICVDLTSSPCAAGAFEEVDWPLPNVWLGVSVEDQRAADERIPPLLATPAAKRWISAEPLLGPVNIEPWLAPSAACQGCDDGEGYGNRCESNNIPRDEQCPWKRAVQILTEHGPFSSEGEPAAITSETRQLDWVIVGGESGPGARPMHPGWARSLRDQCASAGVPFLFKQWGSYAPLKSAPEGTMFRGTKKITGRLLDGVLHDGFPA